MSKTVCIYHANCYDGMAAAWVVNRRFPDCELRAANYGDLFPFHEYGKNDMIYIVDFSYPRDIMIAIANETNNLLVLDHHKTAQANCEGLPFCIFDMNESGASLTWKYFFPNTKISALVRYIKDRDLWLFQEPNSEAVNAWIQSYPMTIKSYDMMNDVFELDEGHIVMAGESILRYKNQLVDNICKNAVLINGIPTVQSNVLQSEIGNKLCQLNPYSRYSEIYFDIISTSLSVKRIHSLRSIGDFDVSEIAKQHGGGGHKNAAGYQEDL